MRRSQLVPLVALLIVAGSCTVKKTEPPPLAGPSTLALALSVTAAPDHLSQDGASQSQITVVARNENGDPVGNVALRLDLTVGGVITDFGRLSAKNLVTGGDGRATAAYTAPPAPLETVDQMTVITLLVTPVDGDYRNAQARSVDIRLVPPGVILPPNGTPVPAFTISPAAPTAFADVFFDGSASVDDGTIVSYAWNFGDGSTATGRTATHQFRGAGVYIVTLTVTDDRNMTASTSKSISVTASVLPTASFVFSPADPVINQDILFNAAESTAGPGRYLVAYDWDFGSGTPQRGLTVTKSYDVPGTYAVSLTVTDDVGQKGTISRSVTVSTTGAGSPVAAFTYSPTVVSVGKIIYFDASDSTSAAPIVTYQWEWGDGTHGATGQTAQHVFSAAGSYVVRLTITDAAGRKATTTKTISVTAAP